MYKVKFCLPVRFCPCSDDPSIDDMASLPYIFHRCVLDDGQLSFLHRDTRRVSWGATSGKEIPYSFTIDSKCEQSDSSAQPILP